jgi:hypothetical protein
MPPMPGRHRPGRCRGPGPGDAGPFILPHLLQPEPVGRGGGTAPPAGGPGVQPGGIHRRPGTADPFAPLLPGRHGPALHRCPGRGHDAHLRQSAGQRVDGRIAGIPTPAWIGPWPGQRFDSTCMDAMPARAPGSSNRSGSTPPSAWTGRASSKMPILQPCFPLLRSRAPLLGGACFAERFIAGREFNLSVLGGPPGPRGAPAGGDRF